MALERVGRFELLQTLGQGARGFVCLARDPAAERRVTLNALWVDPADAGAGEVRERFLSAARQAEALQHHAIAATVEVGEDPETGLLYVATERAEGSSLEELRAAGVRFLPSEAVWLASEVADAVHHAHARGVVHGGLSPAAIVTSPAGALGITGFGVAGLIGATDATGLPSYLSPEQVAGQPADERSDLFSLGVLLFELLTGERPFTGRTAQEVTQRIAHESPPIPSTVAPGLPPALNPIVLKCLDKDPARRFQTGAELAAVLAALSRSLAQRETADSAPADLQQPTPLPGGGAGERRQPSARPGRRGLTGPLARARELTARMPLPPILRLEVEPSWVLRLLAAWVLLWAATLSVLALRRDLGPYPGPSAGSARNLHHAVTAIRDAQALLAAGDTAGAAARAQAALDQAPASAPARRVLAEARQAAGSSGGGEDMVAALVSEGLELLDRGLARRAADRFQQALALDPESSSARTYLAQAQAAAATSPQPARRTSSPAAAGATPLPDQAAPARLPPAPTPGTARITVFFNSPINAGSLEVTLDGTSLSEIPFDFTRKGMLGIKRKGSGQVKRVLLVPAGRHVVGISLEEAEKGSLGEASFTEVLPAGTDWTLRVDLPEGAPQAGFFLVRAAGG